MSYNNNLIKYNLKDKKDANSKTQIFLIFAYKKDRLRYYIRRRIEPKYWDSKKQRVKSSYPNYDRFNKFLNSIANFLEDEFNKLEIQGEIITIQKLRELLDERLNREEEKGNDFFRYYEEFIESSKNIRKESTLRYHRSTLRRLKKFSKSKKMKLTFESFNHRFEQQLKDFLINEYGLANNTVSRYFKSIKVVLNWAVEKGYNKNLEFRKFKNKYSDGEIYFLKWDELMNLFELELDNPKLRRVRDIFSFGCFTGLRFSDIVNLKQDNVFNDIIEINTIKTNTKTRIPLNKYSSSIYERYKSDETVSLFPRISNQKMNEYLKGLGKMAGINEPVQIIHYSGTKRTDKTVPKYEVLTSHIARKTFITNAMIRGMSTEVIMDITTHNSYKTFQRYFKIVDEYKKEQMEKVFG